DRHGTSVVVLAGLINSLKIVKKSLKKIKIVIAGAGSAGYGIAQLLHFSGCQNIVVLDSSGSIYQGRKDNMDKYKKDLSKISTGNKINLEEALVDADVFIGVSGKKNLLKSKMIRSMKREPIIFALTNPYPEINPKFAKRAGAKIIATGSYQYNNQVNNALVFPYIMRAMLDLKITNVTLEILYSTAIALAQSVPTNKLSEDFIIPEIGDQRLQKKIVSSLKKLL
ncbi:MAG: NAD-dependent malic enzyme, partial [Nitrosopumilaceae archaeon]|nr:NAD-dependent malic enzyme [Nitrosopumilaceae archaeon]NIU89135.1 NAD-dependent malic enzyme [Nitrosopumilaceae archaeon]NIV67230.1 NAD-dependent malic enzyme [Nitrosopumilaceae archaeon]NIX63285.1 NAD-dependent malic enzyme [Nitrosopumilaceae archaeon]